MQILTPRICAARSCAAWAVCHAAAADPYAPMGPFPTGLSAGQMMQEELPNLLGTTPEAQDRGQDPGLTQTGRHQPDRGGQDVVALVLGLWDPDQLPGPRRWRTQEARPGQGPSPSPRPWRWLCSGQRVLARLAQVG